MANQFNSNDRSNHKANTPARRAMLKTLLAGSGAVAAAGALPVKWTRPVVDAIVLPAHALTSNLATHFRGTVPANPITSTGPLQRAIDALIPPAYAGAVSQVMVDLCIDSLDGVNFSAEAQFGNLGYGTASGTVGGGPVPFNFACDSLSLINLAVSGIDAAGAAYAFSGFATSSGTLPPGSGCPANSCKF